MASDKKLADEISQSNDDQEAVKDGSDRGVDELGIQRCDVRDARKREDVDESAEGSDKPEKRTKYKLLSTAYGK